MGHCYFSVCIDRNLALPGFIGIVPHMLWFWAQEATARKLGSGSLCRIKGHQCPIREGRDLPTGNDVGQSSEPGILDQWGISFLNGI